MESLKDVTLRPWPAPKSEELSQQDLYQQIEQLTAERGHLRDITEASLQEDIAAGKDVPGTVEKAQSGKDEKDTLAKQTTPEKVLNMQKEMFGHLE